MRLLFDTSTLIAALVQEHPSHTATKPWLDRVLEEKDEGVVAAHSIAELYAKLTSIRFSGRKASAQEARQVLAENIERSFWAVALTADEYVQIVKNLSQKNLIGGIIYDALIVYAGIKADVDHILTLNPHHFRQIYPDHADRIIDPTEAAS